ncbi:hypothetical protein BRYFOR_07162 [Marvinbryantia formatexigens DSM 14469]|uniref:Uncharacterized protein n=1 Tax=Marvinbryantia formatexigens DSM 14469 TaxID=478749 RepID=C6LEW2_9FIRM|nr:hypothetical protein BRYFOR_07162 [Marvinbryantia formatexigens DSM 14469]
MFCTHAETLSVNTLIFSPFPEPRTPAAAYGTPSPALCKQPPVIPFRQVSLRLSLIFFLLLASLTEGN